MTEVKGGHEAEAALWRPGTRPAPPRTGRISSSHRAPTPRALSLGARRRHTHKATSREGGRPRIEARQVRATRDGASSRPGPVRGVRQLALRRAARLHLLPPLPHHRARALALPARQQTASVWPMAGKGDACLPPWPCCFLGFPFVASSVVAVLFRSLGRAENRIGATAQQDVHVRTLIIVIAVQITQLCSLIPTCCSDVSVSQDRVIKMKHQSITRSEKNSITASQF